MMLSVDLAYMLSTYSKKDFPKCDFENFQFGYDGREALKGVQRGAPYPLIWAHALKGDELTKEEDELIGFESLDRDKLRDFCEKYFVRNSAYVSKPFISGCKHQSFSDVPKDYEAELNHMSDRIDNELKRLKSRNPTDDQTPGEDMISDQEVSSFAVPESSTAADTEPYPQNEN